MANTYISPYRPFGFATLPRKVTYVYVEAPHNLAHVLTDLPRSDHRHGVILTSRELTSEECDTFQLRHTDTQASIKGALAKLERILRSTG